MARLLDTRLIAAADRKAAYVDQFFDHEVPHAIGFDNASEHYSGVVDYWRLGTGVNLHRTIDTGTRLLRTQRHLRIAAPERFGVVLKLAGSARVGVNGEDTFVGPGDMWLLDQTKPTDYESHGPGAVQALNIDYSEIGLGVDTVRFAACHIVESPLFSMFRQHLVDVFRAADSLENDAELREGVAEATLKLTRALILTVSGRNLK